MEIQDRVAIVTGAASGIGRATAVALAQAGARAVVLADLQEAEQTAAAVTAAGSEALPLRTDVADLDSLRKLFSETESRYGRLDVLHNNAGMGEGSGMWPDVEPERCAAIVDVNLRAVVLGTQLALEPMKRSGGGVVVNTSSGAAFMPLPPQAVYAGTKAGVVNFTNSCTHLAESYGVRVNCVCPGIVETPMILETGDGRIADWLRPFYDSIVPFQPEDVAAVVLDLIRDESKVGEIVNLENEPRDEV